MIGVLVRVEHHRKDCRDQPGCEKNAPGLTFLEMLMPMQIFISPDTEDTQ